MLSTRFIEDGKGLLVERVDPIKKEDQYLLLRDRVDTLQVLTEKFIKAYNPNEPSSLKNSIYTLSEADYAAWQLRGNK